MNESKAYVVAVVVSNPHICICFVCDVLLRVSNSFFSKRIKKTFMYVYIWMNSWYMYTRTCIYTRIQWQNFNQFECALTSRVITIKVIFVAFVS